MKNFILFLSFSFISFRGVAQFAPPAGQTGSTAFPADSVAFVSWATGCNVTRGYQDISNQALGYASAGDSLMALGKAGSNGVVSLGDGGSATLTFDAPIENGPGWDFAVFENSFSDDFLELAFVEVSSDGVNFYRFPATSNTQTDTQVNSFGSLNATKINNLAGKYRALYGTPFDLEELAHQSGLDINHVTHVKVIDVVGCIQDAYATHDQYEHKVNDPWNTPFASGGFDLDAVGVINQVVTAVPEKAPAVAHINIFPNPVKNHFEIQYSLNKNANSLITITDIMGRMVYREAKQNQPAGWQSVIIPDLHLTDGIYFLKVAVDDTTEVQKIIVANE